MVTERRFYAVIPQLLQSNGGTYGEVLVPNSLAFKVNQVVYLRSNTLPPLKFRVKRIDAPTRLYLGSWDKGIADRTDLSAFTIGDSSVIYADEQERTSVPNEAIFRAIFEEEPANALRNFLVDSLGNGYTELNPFPVGFSSANPIPVVLTDGSINIGTVNAEVEVQLSSKDNSPNVGDVHDSVRLGDQNNEVTVAKAAVGTRAGLDVVGINDLFSKPYTKLTVLTKNDDGDPLTIRSRYQGTNVQLMTITYDADGDFQDADVSDL